MKKKVSKPTRSSEVEALLSSGMVKEVLTSQNKKYSDAEIILLNDGKTYIILEEQDYYSYHDCSTSARHLRIYQNEEGWNNYLKNLHPAHSVS
jgi:hypothetical protein